MLFLIVTFILCFPLVLFALSNTQVVRLGIWPTDYSIDVRLSLAILIAMAVAFLIGALVVWMSELAQRSRARRAERTVRLLEAQVAELKARTGPTMALPPAA
jgi:putative membrane protein